MENKYILITPAERKLLRDSYQMFKSDKTKTWRIPSFLMHTHRHRHTLLQYNLFVTVFKLHVCVLDTVHMNAYCLCVGACLYRHLAQMMLTGQTVQGEN